MPDLSISTSTVFRDPMKNWCFLLVVCGLLASCGVSNEAFGPPKRNTNPSRLTSPNKDRFYTKDPWTYTEEIPEDHTDSGDVAGFYQREPSKKALEIADYAMGYLGTRYKYGGTTKRGMDCSGLIYVSFINAGNVFLPRTSHAMAKEGKAILKGEVNVGDLLFFKTNKRKNKINHVGLVVKVEPGKISFIHATTHGGVMISNLNQTYWKSRFAEARRVLDE